MYQVSWRNGHENGPWLGVFPLPNAGMVRIGRAKDADVHLDDSTVSRSHAVIICNGEKIEIADAGSGNGTKLGGARLSHSLWNSKDLVLIGPFELRLSRHDGPAQSQYFPATSLESLKLGSYGDMIKGAGIAALVLSIIAIFVPVIGLWISGIACALAVIAALWGDQKFAVATPIIAGVNTYLLSPTVWLMLSQNRSLHLIILLFLAAPFAAIAFNASEASRSGKPPGH